MWRRYLSVRPRLTNQRAETDQTHHFSDRHCLLSDSSELFPFGELTLTEGTKLIVRERVSWWVIGEGNTFR